MNNLYVEVLIWSMSLCGLICRQGLDKDKVNVKLLGWTLYSYEKEKMGHRGKDIGREEKNKKEPIPLTLCDFISRTVNKLFKYPNL